MRREERTQRKGKDWREKRIREKHGGEEREGGGRREKRRGFKKRLAYGNAVEMYMVLK